MIGFKTGDCKKYEKKVEFYTHVVAPTPQDRSHVIGFRAMCTASFLGFFTSGRRSRGRPYHFYLVPNIV